jgi:MscS family membrane protein
MIQIEFLQNLSFEARSVIVRILLAVLTLVIIWLLRRLITWLILTPLRRLVVERTITQIDDMLINAAETPIRFLIVAIGISIAGEILRTDFLTGQFVANLSRTFVILAIVILIHNAVRLMAQSSARLRYVTGLQIDEQLVPFLRTGLQVIIIALAIVVLLQEWDYDVSGLVAGLGLGGLAFSLAAQDTVSNLFAFTTIVSDRPFMVGEYIKTPDAEGIVESVGMRNVRIRQLDQAYVTIPNAKLTGAPITNWSRLQKRWLNFTIGLTYSTRSDQMRALVQQIREMLLAHEQVDPDSVVVLFTDFGESSLNVLVRCYIWEPNWVKFHEHKQEINLKILDIIADLGLSIAFPSRSLYLENVTLPIQEPAPHLRPLPADPASAAPPLSAQYPGASSGDEESDDNLQR